MVVDPQHPISWLNSSGPVCLFFVGTDCPISNGYAPEIARIVTQYSPRGVIFHAVYPWRDVSAEQIERHAREYGLPLPPVFDPELKLARCIGATHVPQAVLLAAAKLPVYTGRVDDRYPAAGGKRREHPTTHDLRNALDDLLAGRSVRSPRTVPVGCHLDFSFQN